MGNSNANMKAWLFWSSMSIIAASHGSQNKGPYTIAVYNQLKDVSLLKETTIQMIEYPATADAYIMYINAFRTSQNYHVIAWYTLEENSYSVTLKDDEITDMIKTNECKLGKELKTHTDDDCWKDLDQITRDVRVKAPKEFDPGFEEVVAFKSSCKITWNCGIHKMKIDLFAGSEDSISYNLFVHGPDGAKIRVDSSKSFVVKTIKHSSLAVYTVKKTNTLINASATCIRHTTTLCHVQMKGRSIIVEFFGPIATYKNFVFYNPLTDQKNKMIDPIVKPIDGDSTDPATKADLRQVDEKVVYLSELVSYDFNQVMKEIVQQKNTIIELVNSVSKMDEELIGKISKVPMATKWLSSRTFIFTSKITTFLNYLNFNNTCIPNFSYKHGRWILNKRNESCVNHTGEAFSLFANYLNNLDSLSDAPDFLNVSDENEGWNYIAGKNFFDLLSPDIKYKDHGSFFDGILGSWNLKWIIQLAIIAVIVLVIIALVIKIL